MKVPSVNRGIWRDSVVAAELARSREVPKTPIFVSGGMRNAFFEVFTIGEVESNDDLINESVRESVELCERFAL